MPLFTNLRISSETLKWAEAKEYCEDWNGHLIVLDSQDKWNYFTAHDQYQEYRLHEGFYWIYMRFNDTFKCGDGKVQPWVYSGWGRGDTSYQEPDGCPEQSCVLLLNNQMYTARCYTRKKALCETDPTTTSRLDAVDGDITHSSTHFTESDTAVFTVSSPETDVFSTLSLSTQTTEAEGETISDLQETSATSVLTPTTALVTHDVNNSTCNTCCLLKNLTKLDRRELDEILRGLRIQLEVNKTMLSSQRRKLISVYDSRPSSVAMGGVACIILAAVVGVIVVPDGVSLVRLVYKQFESQHDTSVSVG
ncbi:uncharacterized protein LOC117315680 [Pecten maximus]|uniref:uncharacterized protein LOC117315680 n=1 Tax=Pecten maximus TaxID=6579 RepID=UPI001458473C|nr:uncharacterized protein LOC117315680 [Pecten maximus]